jgi:hypothetical protein
MFQHACEDNDSFMGRFPDLKGIPCALFALLLQLLLVCVCH